MGALVRVILDAHPLAAGGIALQRGLDEGHGSRAVPRGREIPLWRPGSPPAGNDSIGKVQIQIGKRLVITLRMTRREPGRPPGRLAQVRFAAPQGAYRLVLAAM